MTTLFKKVAIVAGARVIVAAGRQHELDTSVAGIAVAGGSVIFTPPFAGHTLGFPHKTDELGTGTESDRIHKSYTCPNTQC